jgi:hypothetical protein
MSTEDLQGTHNGNQPEKVPQLPPAVLPPEPEPVVVVEIRDGCFQDAYANCPIRLVVVLPDNETDEDPAEDNNLFEVDGEMVYVTEIDLTWDGEIPTDITKALKAADIDVPGFSVAADGSGPRAFTLETIDPEVETSEENDF